MEPKMKAEYKEKSKAALKDLKAFLKDSSKQIEVFYFLSLSVSLSIFCNYFLYGNF